LGVIVYLRTLLSPDSNPTLCLSLTL